jgi:hypothetical protein
MTYALRFLPQVETDVRNGRTWYGWGLSQP